MNFEDALNAFTTSETLPIEQIQWVLDAWDTTAADCRTLLAHYLDGKDWSERTEQALYVVILLLAEKADTASFPDLCRFAIDTDRCNSVLGEDYSQIILPAVLIDTFDGDSGALYRIVETPGADALIRGEMLAALAYLVRTNRVPEGEFYQYLSRLPDTLPESTDEFVWYDWVRAIAMLGFAGLSNRVEQILQRIDIDPKLMDSATFWEDLRTAQAAPNEMVGPAWDGIGPIGSAIEFLQSFGEEDSDGATYDAPPEPIRNPLRNVGRNDPCPCGSGKKFKKCCLV